MHDVSALFDLSDAGVTDNVHALCLMAKGYDLRDFRGDTTRQNAGQPLDQGSGRAELPRARRQFQADKSAANDRNPAPRSEAATYRHRVGMTAKCPDTLV